MPLHKPKCLPAYHQQLSYCVTQVGLGGHGSSAVHGRAEQSTFGRALRCQLRGRALSHPHHPILLIWHAFVSGQFVEKDPRLADGVIRALLKFWPLTNSHKEVLFLGELEEVLELTQVCLCARG